MNCFCIQASCLLYFVFRHFAHMNTFAQTPRANLRTRTDARRSAANIWTMFQFSIIHLNIFELCQLSCVLPPPASLHETNIFVQVKAEPWLLSSSVFIIFLSNIFQPFTCFSCQMFVFSVPPAAHTLDTANQCGELLRRCPLQPRNCSSLNFWRQSSTTPKAPFPKILMYSWAP